MRIKQVIGLVILFIGPFSIPSSGQVVATWIDSSGNWSNSANWSTLTVPNNGGGKTYDVVINGTQGPIRSHSMRAALPSTA